MAQTLMSKGTLTLERAVASDWDTIVVGAGPAGALAARQLALAGLGTLLIERQSFPRNKVCGGCLNGRALEVLRSVDLDDALNALSPVALNRFVVQANRRRVELDLPAGAAIKRSSFDAMLVQAAIEGGAAFLPETFAIVENDERTDLAGRRVQLRQHGGSPRTVRAKVIVAADGLGHPSLQRIPAFACQVESASRIGIGTTIREVPGGYCSNTIYMALAKWGYVGLVQTGDGSWNLAAALDPKALKGASCAAALVENTVGEAGLPKLPSLDSCTWQGTPPLTRQSSCLAAARVFLLGDAAGYMEPFTGEGMGWALSSAIAVAPAVMQTFIDGSEVAAVRWNTTQRRQLQRGQRVCHILSGLLRRPALVGAGLHALSTVPSLVNPLVRRVHGRPAKVGHL
jgi:menaquinone-9 beta-reductase